MKVKYFHGLIHVSEKRETDLSVRKRRNKTAKKNKK